MDAVRSSLRLDKAFKAEANQYAELDDAGKVVTRKADS